MGNVGNKSSITESMVTNAVSASVLSATAEDNTNVKVNQSLGINNSPCTTLWLNYCETLPPGDQLACSAIASDSCNIDNVSMYQAFTFSSSDILKEALKQVTTDDLTTGIKSNLKQENTSLFGLDNSATEDLSQVVNDAMEVDTDAIADALTAALASQKLIIEGGGISGITMYSATDIVSQKLLEIESFQDSAQKLASTLSASLEQDNSGFFPGLSQLFSVLLLVCILAVVFSLGGLGIRHLLNNL